MLPDQFHNPTDITGKMVGTLVI